MLIVFKVIVPPWFGLVGEAIRLALETEGW
jgi:hypothetical protein